MFILGQMYANENKKDSAAVVFHQLTAFKKAPYKYKIHANIELAKNVENDSLSTNIIKRLEKLIKNRDNRPYLDQLYHQVGVLYEKKDSISLAISYYNKSLQSKNGGEKQQSFTYESLANLYFKNSEYQLASSYYDSILNVSRDTLSLRVRRVKRKHKNLASLIKFEEVVAKNDSIIRIASLPKKRTRGIFSKLYREVKKER